MSAKSTDPTPAVPMGDGSEQSDDSTALRNTIERLEETEELEALDRESVLETYRSYRDDADEVEDSDELLEYLRETNVIDRDTYISAAGNEPVRVGAPEFDDLPSRERYYEAHGLVDEGGMARIHVGEDPHLQRNVALKILREKHGESEIERRRFLREAQITAKLAHPNIVPVHSLHSEGENRASFSMKLVDGETLFDVVERARKQAEAGEALDEDRDMRRRIDLFLRVCDAVAYAHDRGVVHRDLKPSNIMVGAYNEVYVMDWGIAKLVEEPSDPDDSVWEAEWQEVDSSDEVQTQAGSLVGTPPYMSPEQARGAHAEIDARADLYSLGAILFELVTLRRMVPGNQVHEVLQNAQKGRRAPFEPRAPGERIEPELRAIVEKSTAIDPDERYDSVDALAEEVRRYLDNREVHAHPDGPLRRITRWMSHNREIALAAGFGIFFVAAAATIWSLWQQKRAVQASRTREAQISRLQAEVSSRAHRIDRQFLRFELLVRRLAISARELLAAPPKYDGPIFSSSDFGDPDDAPDDLRRSPVYGKPISIARPVYKLAPETAEKEVMSTIRQMMPLRSRFRSMFLDSRLSSDRPATSSGDYWRIIAEEGVPGRWAFVGLESGVHVAYPGKGAYPTSYDPRQRPWYRVGEKADRVSWGAPYPDAQGQGLVLPCVAPVRADDGSFLGVAGFEVTLDFIKEQFMRTTDPLAATFVLDSTADTLVASDGATFDELAEGARADIREMVRADESGVRTHSESTTDVFAVYRMPTLDWFYVARAPLPAVLEWRDGSVPGR